MIILRTFISLAIVCLFSGTRNLRGHAADEMVRYRMRPADLRLQLRTWLNGHSEICFLAGYILTGVLLGTSLVKPSVALAGMVSVLSACLFKRVISVYSGDWAFFSPGLVTCNPLLVGLSIGYLFGITTMTIILIAGAGIFTLVLTGIFDRMLRHGCRLPILVLPLAIVSAIVSMVTV